MMYRMHTKKRNIGLVVLIFGILLVGVCIFWFGLRAFRAHADERSLAQEDPLIEEDILSDTSFPPTVAILRSPSDGEVGRIARTPYEQSAMLDVVVTLPSIDAASYAYHVWLIKDGLVDVVDIGALTPRADGTFGGTFFAGPATGVVRPELFSEVVIMLEPHDDHAAPSGIKMCSGSW